MEVTEVENYAIYLMQAHNDQYNEFINNLAWGKQEKEEIIRTILEEGLVKDTNSLNMYELNKIFNFILFKKSIQ